MPFHGKVWSVKANIELFLVPYGEEAWLQPSSAYVNIFGKSFKSDEFAPEQFRGNKCRAAPRKWIKDQLSIPSGKLYQSLHQSKRFLRGVQSPFLFGLFQIPSGYAT